MEKTFGATERHDQLLVLGTRRAVLVYGYGEEDGQGYDWRHTFNYRPTKDEVLNVLKEHIDGQTDAKMLTGYVWHDMPVWLSMENQFNYKAAFDLAAQTQGATLPITFKLGEQNGEPVYFTFRDMQTFTDFYVNAFAFLNATLNEGWQQKDAAAAWVDSLDFDTE